MSGSADSMKRFASLPRFVSVCALSFMGTFLLGPLAGDLPGGQVVCHAGGDNGLGRHGHFLVTAVAPRTPCQKVAQQVAGHDVRP